MDKYAMKSPKKRILFTSIALFIGLTLLLIFIVTNLSERWYQAQVIETTDHYIAFQYSLTNLFESGSTLLTGYEAYLKVNGTLADSQTEAYLNHLTEKEMLYILNLAIIEDTTIIYNFPPEGNEASIGVNLATISGQSEGVLNVKNSGQGYVDGPVDLVQGGRGYIIRKPLEDQYGTYWGQVSIVLNADLVESAIASYEEDTDIKVTIYSNEHHDKLIYGDASILKDNPSAFTLNSTLSEWVIYVIPNGGWQSNRETLLSICFLGLIIIAGNVYILIYIQKSNYNLKKVISKDNLTGLYNRHHLELVQQKVLQDASDRAGSFGLMHLDLDHFKTINDKYGHEVGDDVLKETATILSLFTREEELVFRIGGDEFLVILPDIADKEALQYFKERLKKTFDDHKISDQYDVSIGPSIGVGIYPEDGLTFDDVLRKADQAMYQEKGANKR